VKSHPGVAIGLITAVDVAVLVLIGTRHPRPNTLSYELAKASMQVFAVVLGGALSLASLVYQLNQQAQQTASYRRRDARQRRDALMRETLRDDVLSNYNAVKRGRRILQAWRWDPQQVHDLMKIYDEHMAVIDEAQLNLERLEKSALTLGGCHLDGSQLGAWFPLASTTSTTCGSSGNSTASHWPALRPAPMTSKWCSRRWDGYQLCRRLPEGHSRPG
jgi:hypothetical protein